MKYNRTLDVSNFQRNKYQFEFLGVARGSTEKNIEEKNARVAIAMAKG